MRQCHTMYMYGRNIVTRCALLVLLLSSAAAAQDLTGPLPLDPAIRRGTLANGLTFFIRRNEQPDDRAALRLVVKAGSIDEADDQRGLAHLLEHMAFQGSTHFKPRELVDFLESIGSRFGPDVNAYTSFDETVYMFEVPTDRDGIVARGLQALGDFAGGITMDSAEVDRERGVVIEEWRLRQGAGTRMQEAQMRALFGASRYVDRLPIGLPEVLTSFPVQRLRDFYRDHYRPDRMAVIVVGDVDPPAIEALIREHFSGLRAAAPAQRMVHSIPAHEETRFASLSDPEAQASSVTIVHKHPREPFNTAADYRRVVVRSLIHDMLNGRFAEIAQRPDAAFLRASSGDQALGQTVEAFTVSARVAEGGIEKGLAALEREIARIRQHGFGEAELDRAKKTILATYERAFNERDKSPSGGFASELVRHFLTGEPAPGIAVELELVRKMLPAISVSDVAGLARELLGDDNRVVLAISPAKGAIPVLTEGDLREALRAGGTGRVEPWEDAIEGRELMAMPPTPGTVRARREIPELGVTILTLSNGVEVWLKPTDFRNDQVSFTSYARGGVSLAPEEDYLNASLSTSLIGLAGVGGVTPTDLEKLLAGRIANASPYMSSYSHGISGGSTPRDLEMALQLTHLYFTAPNRDPAAFELLKRRLEAAVVNQAQNPAAVFAERVQRLNTNDHYSARALKVEDVQRLDRERMLSYYDARFRNAADFTFFVVGAFTVDDITPLLTTYIASLPSTSGPTAAIGDMRLEFPDAVQRETVRKGQEPRSDTAITFFSDTGLDELEAHRLRAATSVLEDRLRDVLREELGGTYSVQVSSSDIAPQSGYGTTTIRFGSSPENAQRLTTVVMSEIDRLRKEGPSEHEIQVVRETETRQLETALGQNIYWLNSLQLAHLLGRDPRRIPLRIERARSLTLDNVHAAVRKYLPSDRYTVVTLMPETAGYDTVHNNAPPRR